MATSEETYCELDATRDELQIIPCAEGSYLVQQATGAGYPLTSNRHRRAFSNYAAMLAWFASQAPCLPDPPTPDPDPKEGFWNEIRSVSLHNWDAGDFVKITCANGATVNMPAPEALRTASSAARANMEIGVGRVDWPDLGVGLAVDALF